MDTSLLFGYIFDLLGEGPLKVSSVSLWSLALGPTQKKGIPPVIITGGDSEFRELLKDSLLVDTIAS